MEATTDIRKFRKVLIEEQYVLNKKSFCQKKFGTHGPP